MQKSKSGFTLIELVVVIVIIGILATLTFLSYAGIQGRARDDRRLTDVSNIEKAMELYYSDNGSYPVPTGPTGSTVNSYWYTSGDSSWDMFSSLMVNAQAINEVPVGPSNASNKSPLYENGGGYGYAVYVNGVINYCGAGPGQMYIIVYRLEGMAKQRSSDGPCATNPVGDQYYDEGASYYRNTKNGS